MSDNWSNVRGKKILKRKNRNVDFNLINKRIISIVNTQIKLLDNNAKIKIPNKYGKWIIN